MTGWKTASTTERDARAALRRCARTAHDIAHAAGLAMDDAAPGAPQADVAAAVEWAARGLAEAIERLHRVARRGAGSDAIASASSQVAAAVRAVALLVATLCRATPGRGVARLIRAGVAELAVELSAAAEAIEHEAMNRERAELPRAAQPPMGALH